MRACGSHSPHGGRECTTNTLACALPSQRVGANTCRRSLERAVRLPAYDANDKPCRSELFERMQEKYARASERLRSNDLEVLAAATKSLWEAHYHLAPVYQVRGEVHNEG